MKKLFALISCFFICFCLFAQQVPKFSLSIFGSPSLAYRTEGAPDYIPYTVSTFFEYPHDEWDVPKLGSAFGVLAAWHLNDRLQLQTGLTFSNNGWRLEKRTSNIGVLGPVTNVPYATNLNFYYLDIPVQVKYTFLKKQKFGLYAIGGMEANFNVMNRHVFIAYPPEGPKHKDRNEFYYLDLQKWTTNEPSATYQFRKCNFSAAAGAGIDIYLNSRVTLFSQPTFRFMFLPILDTPVKWRLYSAGLLIGITINF